MPDDKRIGRQFPTQSLVLPYTETRGGEAVLLYDQSKRKTMPWQQAMLYDIMATDDDGLWKHIKFGWSIARLRAISCIPPLFPQTQIPPTPCDVGGN